MNVVEVYLTKAEKIVLRSIAERGEKRPDNISQDIFLLVVSELQAKGLIKYIADNGEVLSARLTDKGHALLKSNPKLNNPIDWAKWITAISTLVTAGGTIALLFFKR